MFLTYCFLYIAGCENSGTTFFPPNPVDTVGEVSDAPKPALLPKPPVVDVAGELPNPEPAIGAGGVYDVPAFDGRERPPLFAPFNFS
jgi:hypothetical protein